MNYLLYQSYGNKDILNECCYSILSLIKQGINKDQIQIIVYTDQPAYFSFIPSEYIQIVVMDNITIAAYKGPYGFVHRLKIKVIQDCMERFKGNILYVDSDTYFTKSLNDLFASIQENTFVMCNNEGAINTGNNGIFRKIVSYIKSDDAYLKEHNIQIPADMIMWNAGVIGLLSSNKEVVSDVLSTNDILFKKHRSHVVEQLSFSYQLQLNGSVHEACTHVFHYWNFKEFRTVLFKFFNHHLPQSSLETILKDIDSIRPDVLIQPKMEYESLSFIPKNLRKLSGKNNRWKFPPYCIGATEQHS